MIDYHCHILPGIDDGSTSMEESLAMARSLREAGYTTVHCTPHLIKGSFETDNAVVRKLVAALQAKIYSERIDLRLLPGREYFLDEFLPGYLKDPLPLGETRYILVEIPSYVPEDFVKESCYRIIHSGYTPLIAHPERCRLLEPIKDDDRNRISFWGSLMNSKLTLGRQSASTRRSKTQNSELKASALLDYLQEIGCGFQGNLGSFTGLYGKSVRRSADRLRKLGVYSHFGTDLHSSGGPGLKTVLGQS